MKYYTGAVIVTADVSTISGKFFPEAILQDIVRQVTAIPPNAIANEFLGELFDPKSPNQSSSVNMSNVVIKVARIRMAGNQLIADFSIIDTPVGLTLQSALKADPTVDVQLALVGTGKMTTAGLIRSYSFLRCDCYIVDVANMVKSPLDPTSAYDRAMKGL